MKNIFVSEILSDRDLPVLNIDASFAELISLMKTRGKTHHCYLTDHEGTLKGAVLLKDILEYLSPYFLLTGRDQMDNLSEILEHVPLKDLIRTDIPAVPLNNTLPEVLEKLMLSGLSAIPVVNHENKAVGEITCEQIIQVMPIKEREECCALS